MYTTEAVQRRKMLALIQDGRRVKDGFLAENTAFAPEIVAGDLSDESFDAKVRHYFDDGYPFLLAESMRDGRVALVPMRHFEKRSEVSDVEMFWDIKSGIWTWN